MCVTSLPVGPSWSRPVRPVRPVLSVEVGHSWSVAISVYPSLLWHTHTNCLSPPPPSNTPSVRRPLSHIHESIHDICCGSVIDLLLICHCFDNKCLWLLFVSSSHHMNSKSCDWSIWLTHSFWVHELTWDQSICIVQLTSTWRPSHWVDRGSILITDQLHYWHQTPAECFSLQSEFNNTGLITDPRLQETLSLCFLECHVRHHKHAGTTDHKPQQETPRRE